MSEILFTSEECEWLKTFYSEDESIDGSKPLKMLTKDGKEITITLRQGKKGNKGFFYHSNDTELLNFLKEKLYPLGVRKIKDVKFIKYQKGDVLAPHVDFGRYGVESNYKTLVVQLSDEDDYSGGDFCLWGEPQSRKQGSYNFFLRTVEHEVTEVTDGVRYSMSLFLTEDDLELKKTII